MKHIRFLGSAMLTALLIACVPSVEKPETDGNKNVSIYRDSWGTPHIHAATNYGVYYGYGYALASDRLFQMEMLHRTVNGRVAEVLGEKYIALDSHIRTAYDHRAVAQQLAALPAQDLEIIEAYADGYSKRVNEVLAGKHELPHEFTHYGFKPSTWTAHDAAMQFVGAIAHRYSDFNSELDNAGLLQALTEQHGADKAQAMFNASKWLLDDDSPTTVPRDTALSQQSTTAKQTIVQNNTAHDTTVHTKRILVNEHGQFIGSNSNENARKQFTQLLAEHGWGFSPEFAPASNFWAVQKLKDADAAFVNGPQFGWSTPSYVYGVGLHGGDFNVVGNTLLGLPSLLFAHNNKVAWGSTAGLSDQVDVYIEKLNPENPEQYWHNNAYRDYERWQESIKVKDGDTITLTARRSVHGMVQQWHPDKHVAYSRARSWEGKEVASLVAWVNLAKSDDLDTLRQHIGEVGTNINFYTMDAQGNLGYTHAGRYPKRTANHDARLPVNGDGSLDWQGFLPYAENPTVRNPEQAYIVNWNNRPSANWPSSDIWPLTWARSDRVDHLSNAIESTAIDARDTDWLWQINEQVSFSDVSAMYLLPHLARAIANTPLTKQEQAAWTLLNNWDQTWRDVDGFYGAAPALMEAWHRILLQNAFADEVGKQQMHFYSATHTPNKHVGPSMGTPPGTRALVRILDKQARGEATDYDFFNGQSAKILTDSFKQAVAELDNRFAEQSKWQIKSWGLRWQPYNFRGVPQALASAEVSLGSYMNRGSENNLFIARNGKIESFDVIPPGQKASGKNSNDQMAMFKTFKFKPVPIDIVDVKAQAESVEHLTID